MDIQDEIRLRAYLLVADVGEPTISAIIGHLRQYGSLTRLALIDSDLRHEIDQMLN